MENVLFDVMPVVALRGLVIFPEEKLHFEVGRKKSIAALKAAMANGREIFLVAQKSVSIEEPMPEDLFRIGVVASVQQVTKIPNSENVRVTVNGMYRAEIAEMISIKPYLEASVRLTRSHKIKEDEKDYVNALTRQLKDIFEEYAQAAPRLAPDVLLGVIDEKNPGRLADYIAGNIMIEYEQRYEILKELNVANRLLKCCTMLKSEIELFHLEEKIQSVVQERIDKNQKEYFLREQMRAISEELGEGKTVEDEILSFRDRIKAIGLQEAHEKKLLDECSRLEKMSPSSPEATVSRSYLMTVLNMPWNIRTEDKLDLKNAQKVLDRDHYGLKKVKERIVEMLAVRKLNPDINGQIICLVGPPGVGKTSIARSIAEAMGRKYVRISLGGVHDEAEIRGHRKTYIGSMPGRIMAAMEQAKSSNPLMLLDEVDKLGSDYKGDPSSALLEVLDAEQNFAFCDHYLEVPFDLSKVLFITTANDKYSIPAPLLDRMEIIELGSYTHEEKFNIAKKHLLPKQRKEHGIAANLLRITDNAMHEIIDGYTREAGVRRLEKQIAAICRKTAFKLDEENKRVTVKPTDLEEMLGSRKYKDEKLSGKNEIGVVNGLAWTSVGGEMLQVEAAVLEGKGEIKLTGSLGDVMKESAQAAVSFIRAKAKEYEIEEDFYKTKDIHLHFPAGAVPKDGPSAGVTIATALLSALTETPVRCDIAMTGEISLRGKVLPIGGLREKTMAAYRHGIKTVIIPEENKSDFDEIESVVKENIRFVLANSLETVFENALCEKKREKEIIKENTERKIITDTKITSRRGSNA
ncbi:MAG: endopeptidase La [Ruminococcaceae bacterium]|nr:endopeptidase La [Oscillospiraceae bacterium]